MPQEKKSMKKRLLNALKMIVVQNPVLVTGLALAPAVIGAFTLKNGLGLTLVFAFITIPVLFLAAVAGRFVKDKVPPFVLMFLYAVVAALLLIPARHVAAGISPNLFDSLGMYFSVTAINTVWVLRAPVCQEKKPLAALGEGVIYSLGFGFAVLVVSAVREVLSYGTLWGVSLGLPVRFPAVGYAFGGFIVVGLAAAALRWAVGLVKNLARAGRPAVKQEGEV